MPSIKKTIPFLLYPAIGLLVGWGWVAMESKRPHVMVPDVGHEEKKREVERSRGPIVGRKLLLEETRLYGENMRNHGVNPIGGVISGWLDEEILAALGEALRSPDMGQRHDGVALALLSEIARRNPNRALEWVQELPAVERRKYTGSLIAGWVPEKLDEAFSIVKKHPDLFGKNLPWNLVSASLEDAFQKGPLEYVSRLEELKKEDINSTNLEVVSGVPVDFDYAAVLESPDFKSMNLRATKTALIASWALSDRDAAFQWVLEHDGVGESGQIGLFGLKNQSQEISKAEAFGFIRWMSGKVEGLPPEQRAKFLEVNSHHIQEEGVMWIEAAKDPELKEAIRSKTSELIFSPMYSNVQIGFSAMATLPDKESRLEALEVQLSKRPQYRFVGENEEPVRELAKAYLSEWGVDAQRSESILKRMYDDVPVMNFGQ